MRVVILLDYYKGKTVMPGVAAYHTRTKSKSPRCSLTIIPHFRRSGAPRREQKASLATLPQLFVRIFLSLSVNFFERVWCRVTISYKELYMANSLYPPCSNSRQYGWCLSGDRESEAFSGKAICCNTASDARIYRTIGRRIAGRRTSQLRCSFFSHGV